MADNKHKRFRLSFVNAAEDVPRLVRAYGRACFGEFALVLRPTDSRGVLVLVTKEGARVWRAIGSDAPELPEVGIDPRDAVALVKNAQKALAKDGPITLRGQWSGSLHCDDGTPRVELARKLAAYGLLRITSSPTGWSWTVERTEKWFSEPGSDSGTAPTLVKAIESGLARAMGLLGEACSTRDSHRRAALDETWASTHPIRPAKEGKDPTERLHLEKPRRSRTAAPPRMDEPVALPDAPATVAGVQRMADEVAREADALASLRDVRWVWQDSSTLHDAVVWFREAGLLEIADDLASYEPSPDHPPEQLLERLRVELEGVKLDAATKAKAKQQLGAVAEAFREAPYVLERARRLVRYAARLTETGLCQGRERREAASAIERALHAYEQARAATDAGNAAETRTSVRSTVEWAALAAAKAARACALGQTTLLMPPYLVETAPVVLPEGATPKRHWRPSQAASASPTAKPVGGPETKPTRQRRAKATVSEPVPAPEPASKPMRSPKEKAKAPARTRRAKAAPTPAPEAPPKRRAKSKAQPKPAPAASGSSPSAPRKRGKKAAPAPEADPEKDKLLLDAFRDAVSAAMNEPEPS